MLPLLNAGVKLEPVMFRKEFSSFGTRFSNIFYLQQFSIVKIHFLFNYKRSFSYDSVQAVVTIANGKFFSNGADLDWIKKQDITTWNSFEKELSALVTKILTFPVPTLAAINGK